MGPDETADTYFTTAAGQTVSAVSGRYGRFRVFLVSTDGLATPELGDVQLTHSGTSGSRVTRYVFDPAGNILEVAVTTDSGTETDEREYNDLNQLTTSTGGWTYQYDLDGNMTGKNNGAAVGNECWELAWDENNRLLQVKKGVYDATPALVNEFTVDYQYDQSGRMLRRDDSADVTTYRWDGWDLVGETTGASVTEYLVPGLGIRSFIRDGDLFTLHTDGLGSVRSVTDSSGSVAARFEHSGFGTVLDDSFDSVPGGMPYTWIGGLGVRTEVSTGFVYMRNRWYSPQTQRFISRDPLGITAGANPYAYCGGDPINRVDPSGLKDKDCPSLVSQGNHFWGVVGWLGRQAEANARASSLLTGFLMPGGGLVPSAFGSPSLYNSESEWVMDGVLGVANIAAMAFGPAPRAPLGGSGAVASLKSELGSTTPRFELVKLEKIQAALSVEGVEFSIGTRWGQRQLDLHNAEGLYIPGPKGKPGTVVLPKAPSRCGVVEELGHVGQARRTGWPEDLTPHKLGWEIEMQAKLLNLARRKNWTPTEIWIIEQAQKFWESCK